MQEKEYAQALAMYDTHLSLDNSNKGHQRGLLKAMQEANFDHTLEQYQKNCCLSLQDWDSDLNEVKELLLKRKTEEFDEKIKTMSLGVTMDQGSHGVMTSIYESMAKMKILQEMKTFYAATDIEMIDSAEKVMNIGLNVFGEEYTHLKPILANRCAVLAEIPFLKFDGMNLSNSPHKRRITKINEIKKTSILALVDNSLELCRLSYKNENYNLAYKQLASLQHVGQNCKNQQQLLLDEKTYQIIDDKVEYEKSMLFWSWGEKESAKMQMAHLIKKITKYGSEILPEALRVMGSWLWTLKSEGSYLQLYYGSKSS